MARVPALTENPQQQVVRHGMFVTSKHERTSVWIVLPAEAVPRPGPVKSPTSKILIFLQRHTDRRQETTGLSQLS